ncbi:MAG TPA: hypothetical protein VGF93_11455 [Solirubrobacteraceae bacterium]
MTDQTPTVNSAPAEPTAAGTSASSEGFDLAAFANERPEAVVGAAFAGGFLIATILRRIAR